MQRDGLAQGAVDMDPSQPRGNPAGVALIFSAVGLVLCGAELTAAVATIALPSSDLLTSYFWLALVACGGVGVWPGIVGLVLGLAALIASRKRGEPHHCAWWAVALGAAGPVAVGLS